MATPLPKTEDELLPFRAAIRAWRSYTSDSICMFVAEALPHYAAAGSPRRVVTGLHLREFSPIELLGTDIPPLTMPLADATQLMNDLWAAGVRPTEFQAASETVQAMKEHIADLRTIVLRTVPEVRS